MNKSTSHFYIADAVLTQSDLQVFGPVKHQETDKNRVTSKFSISAGHMAYAVYKGYTLFVPQTGNASKANVIIDPYTQIFLSIIPKVKSNIIKKLFLILAISSLSLYTSGIRSKIRFRVICIIALLICYSNLKAQSVTPLSLYYNSNSSIDLSFSRNSKEHTNYSFQYDNTCSLTRLIIKSDTHTGQWKINKIYSSGFIDSIQQNFHGNPRVDFYPKWEKKGIKINDSKELKIMREILLNQFSTPENAINTKVLCGIHHIYLAQNLDNPNEFKTFSYNFTFESITNSILSDYRNTSFKLHPILDLDSLASLVLFAWEDVDTKNSNNNQILNFSNLVYNWDMDQYYMDYNDISLTYIFLPIIITFQSDITGSLLEEIKMKKQNSNKFNNFESSKDFQAFYKIDTHGNKSFLFLHESSTLKTRYDYLSMWALQSIYNTNNSIEYLYYYDHEKQKDVIIAIVSITKKKSKFNLKWH